jgi:sigma-E factor negative regulatory protein RseA
MKQTISTLMDGELCGEEAELLLGKIKLNSEAQQEWRTYHLIGDALRQPDYVPGDISAAIIERLHAEPTVLAPQMKRSSKASYFAMSAVASIMAVAFLAWLSVQIDNVPTFQQASQQQSGNMRTASLPANEGVNDYLLAHQEYSPSSDVRGAASYIRTVAYNQQGAGK